MADFFTDLWESIFTAGPTPTLLLATNATFAALQLLLLVLLVATYSLHFVALSVICGGLWYAINWFAVEVQRMAEEEKRQKEAESVPGGEQVEDDKAEGTTTGTARQPFITKRGGTEQSQDAASTDNAAEPNVPVTEGTQNAPKVRVRGGPQKILGVMASAKAAREGGDQDTESLQPQAETSTRSSSADKGDMSSSSEWEHVSENER